MCAASSIGVDSLTSIRGCEISEIEISSKFFSVSFDKRKIQCLFL